MKRRKQTMLTADARLELAAVDAALAGERVCGEHDALAGLAVTLRELRPRLPEQFAHALDARAAEGFARRPRREPPARREPLARRAPRRLPPARRALLERARALVLRPATGVALALVIAAAVAVPLLTGEARRAPAPAVRAPAAGPAVVSPPSSLPARADQLGVASPERTPAKSGAASATPGAAVAGTLAPAAGTATRLVERTATLDVGVAPRAIESSAQRVFTLVSAFGGYVRQSSVSSGEAHQGEEAGASFDIRVPSANLSGATAALAHLGHVRSENNTTNDVTAQQTSLRSSLSEVQAERSSVLAQLREATAEAEVAALKARVHALDARVARLEGALRALDQRVTYTSLALSLTSESSAGAASGDLTPGGAAHDAAKILDAALAVLVIAAAALLPLGALAIAAWVAVALTRRRMREQALDAS